MFYTIDVAEKHGVMLPMIYELQLFYKRSKHDFPFGQFLLKRGSGDDYISQTISGIFSKTRGQWKTNATEIAYFRSFSHEFGGSIASFLFINGN